MWCAIKSGLKNRENTHCRPQNHDRRAVNLDLDLGQLCLRQGALRGLRRALGFRNVRFLLLSGFFTARITAPGVPARGRSLLAFALSGGARYLGANLSAVGAKGRIYIPY